MARAKIIDLGLVVKVHASGIVETDKQKRSQIKAEKGDRLLMDVNSRKISIAKEKKQAAPNNLLDAENQNENEEK